MRLGLCGGTRSLLYNGSIMFRTRQTSIIDQVKVFNAKDIHCLVSTVMSPEASFIRRVAVWLGNLGREYVVVSKLPESI